MTTPLTTLTLKYCTILIHILYTVVYIITISFANDTMHNQQCCSSIWLFTIIYNTPSQTSFPTDLLHTKQSWPGLFTIYIYIYTYIYIYIYIYILYIHTVIHMRISDNTPRLEPGPGVGLELWTTKELALETRAWTGYS